VLSSRWGAKRAELEVGAAMAAAGSGLDILGVLS
jgi:hypothetical protein